MTAQELPPEAHVLLVEDDAEMRTLLARFLRQNGYRVTGVGDGRHARETLANAAIDLVLLDVMLPGLSGMDVLRELRASSRVPVIMLTARGDEADRVLGLELGADDYLPKPFSRPELLARIRAVLRRAQGGRDQGSRDHAAEKRGDRIRFAGWALDPRRRELFAPDGSIVDLSSGEYDLLLAFCEHPQRVLTRDQLLDLTRGRAAPGIDRTVDVMVSRLRRKLETAEDNPAIIKTVRNAGYLFAPAVARA